MEGIDVLKSKFEEVQKKSQTYKEQKIRLESELKTLQSDYDEKVKELLELTGTSSVEEAKSFCDEKEKDLETKMRELDDRLNEYLNAGESEDVE